MDYLEFDGEKVSYKMELENAWTSWGAIKSALKVLQDLEVKGQGQELGLGLIQAILGSLDTPEFAKLEKIVLDNTSVIVGSEIYQLSGNKKIEHFNKNRKDLTLVLFEGLKFQFLDFLPSGSLSTLTK